MHRPNTRVVIVGAGPAGLAAAIAASQTDLQVDLFERADSLVNKPGETLHPGIEAVFEKLGVRTLVNSKTTLRFQGIFIEAGDGERIAQPFGKDTSGPWRGYQLARRELLHILHERALELGARVHFSRRVEQIAVGRNDHVEAVLVSGEWQPCDWLLDASGTADWLARCEGHKPAVCSPPLIARYGYLRSHPDEDWPSLRMDSHGWHWRAPLGDGYTAWVDLFTHDQLASSKTAGRGADATWRLAAQPTASNCLRIGDAACRLDPAAGRGVLRALMSGMMAVHSLQAARSENLDAGHVSREFTGWIQRWFISDADELRRLYRFWWLPEPWAPEQILTNMEVS